MEEQTLLQHAAIPMDQQQQQYANTRTLSWVGYGRDYWAASMFTLLVFLNTYFPSTWKSDFMRAFHFAHPYSFYDSNVNISNNEDHQRIRASFHGFKYMLGLYDWNSETNSQVEPFPSCYNLPTTDNEFNYRQALALFKNAVFTKLWYTFSIVNQQGNLEIVDMQLVEITKKALQEGRLAIFTHAEEDLRDPYKRGIRFTFLDEIKLPLDVSKADTEFMRYVDAAGLFMSFDYCPLNDKNQPTGSQIIKAEELTAPETIKRFNRITFKNGIHNTFGGHHASVWNLDSNKKAGFIRPEAVARRKTTMTNGIFLFCRMIGELRKTEGALRDEVIDKLEELGLFSSAHIQRDFGEIPLPLSATRRREGTTTKRGNSAFKEASPAKTGSPPTTGVKRTRRSSSSGQKRTKSSPKYEPCSEDQIRARYLFHLKQLQSFQQQQLSSCQFSSVQLLPPPPQTRLPSPPKENPVQQQESVSQEESSPQEEPTSYQDPDFLPETRQPPESTPADPPILHNTAFEEFADILGSLSQSTPGSSVLPFPCSISVTENEAMQQVPPDVLDVLDGPKNEIVSSGAIQTTIPEPHQEEDPYETLERLLGSGNENERNHSDFVFA